MSFGGGSAGKAKKPKKAPAAPGRTDAEIIAEAEAKRKATYQSGSSTVTNLFTYGLKGGPPPNAASNASTLLALNTGAGF